MLTNLLRNNKHKVWTTRWRNDTDYSRNSEDWESVYGLTNSFKNKDKKNYIYMEKLSLFSLKLNFDLLGIYFHNI